jgi:cytochrome c553
MNRAVLLVLSAIAALSAYSDTAAEDVSTVVDICVVCHGVDGSGAGFDDVPIIAGTPAAHIEEAVYAYQDETRRCVNEPAMCVAVERLTEKEVAEAADHYSAMPRIATDEDFNRHLAAAGEKIHMKHCSRCHLKPDDKNVENALGIPLHGQRTRYLEYAIKAYFDGNRLSLIPQMAEKLALLDEDDVEALIHYYASYRQD